MNRRLLDLTTYSVVSIFWSAAASAESPPREMSDYIASTALVEAGKNYDRCVKVAARKLFTVPDDRQVILNKAMELCKPERMSFESQGSSDFVKGGQTPSSKNDIDNYVGASVVETMMSALADIDEAN